ncbi:transcriptional regulator, TetR family [Gracilibacillus ureilyticus]|uniref:Transcriptional regulator, TetR family n=1 Tax=Gracilibacillus ureilyticus TaxID=531814 RepID=A0A1H9Q952_9BACI|nr:TetR/AcrR family transcriptional regulator [Gracilibacillus ureilyticus]SER57086.1 transcriptional regulator, TetR family [Gracilibacillus ureilyticus]
MDGFEKRTYQKRLNILEAALKLFTNNGIKKVSIAEIAMKANVSQVTIYNYFESKENLLRETMEYYVEKSFDHYQKILDANMPFPDKIEQMIFQKTELTSNIHEEIYSYFLNSSAEQSLFLDKIYQEKSIPFFHQLITEGKESGYIKNELSENAILLFIHMFKDYMQKKDLTDILVPITEDVMHLFFYGIMGKSN